MKRLIVLLSLVAVICSVGFAEEIKNENSAAKIQYRTTSGGFWSCGPDFSGGFGEFGINLLPKENHLVLRDCIFFQGEGGYLAKNDGLEFGVFQVGDKLIIGGRSDCPGFIVRSYGFTGFSMGFISCKGHTFGKPPYVLNLSYGGGFEFQYIRSLAFVVEFGGVNRILAGLDDDSRKVFKDYSKSSSTLTIGFRSFR